MISQTTLTIAVIQQLLLAFTFILIPLAAQKYGQKAQAAAEAAVSKQGVDGKLLAKNSIKFSESKVEMLLPLGFAIIYIVISLLILTGSEFTKTTLWIIEPLTLIIVGIVTTNQVFALSFIKRIFQKSSNPELQTINVEAFIAAALKEFPVWLRPLQIVRFTLATGGSVLVLALIMFLN